MDINSWKIYEDVTFGAYICVGLKFLTLRELDKKYLESSEKWFRKRMDKISWTDRVRK